MTRSMWRLANGILLPDGAIIFDGYRRVSGGESIGMFGFKLAATGQLYEPGCVSNGRRYRKVALGKFERATVRKKAIILREQLGGVYGNAKRDQDTKRRVQVQHVPEVRSDGVGGSDKDADD